MTIKLKCDVVYLPDTNFVFTVRPEQFQTGMFGWTGSKKYAMEYMRYQASLVP